MKLTIGNKIKTTGEEIVSGNAVFLQEDGNKENCAEKMREIVVKRGSKSKFFDNGKGKIIAQFHGKTIHYLDEAKNVFKIIDNRLEETGDGYDLNKNIFKTHFYKHSANGKIFEMEKDLCKVGLFSLEAAENSCSVDGCICNGEGVCEACKVKVKNVTESADIEYTVDSERIKENIIIKEKTEKYEFNFELSLENLAVDVSEDGKNLELIKKDNGNLQFYIPAPFMTDAAGNYSDAAYYEIVQETPEKLSLKVVADGKWINAEDRVFPVIIDPQIVVATYRGAYSYNDWNYDDTIFRYNTYDKNYSSQESNLIGHELRVYYKPANPTAPQVAIESDLIILKNKLPLSIYENFTKAVLKVKVKSKAAPCTVSINNNYYYFNDDNDELEVDITELFLQEQEEITVNFANHGGYGGPGDTDIVFDAPVLEIEGENYITDIEVAAPPKKTSYNPGEHFNPDGMEVYATRFNGEKEEIKDYSIYPDPQSHTLATYDKYIMITYEEHTTYFRGINVAKVGFNDRRADTGMENVYVMYEVDKFGQRTSATEKYVRLELFDGAGTNANRAGTPLNAENLNNIKVKAENIIGFVCPSSCGAQTQQQVGVEENGGEQTTEEQDNEEQGGGEQL